MAIQSEGQITWPFQFHSGSETECRAAIEVSLRRHFHLKGMRSPRSLSSPDRPALTPGSGQRSRIKKIGGAPVRVTSALHHFQRSHHLVEGTETLSGDGSHPGITQLGRKDLMEHSSLFRFRASNSVPKA
ncbi:hypothetical protein CDAR_318041 [Caerostris darwini]|uniref:Uncharacterized protein n=1 Tax=Caerostris darwini TaxID=1538125 RepID=A0AAV4WUN2_9ARAC|nr:hypothetical protein CDAR_318041 [Caerostris darwini]